MKTILTATAKRRASVAALVDLAKRDMPELASVGVAATRANKPGAEQIVAASVFSAALLLVNEIAEEKPAATARELADAIIVELGKGVVQAVRNAKVAK